MEGAPVCLLVGLWEATWAESSVAPNSSAAQRWPGPTSMCGRGGLPPEGCQGNHGCRGPQPLASLPWRQQAGGSKGNGTGGPHHGL